jgi:hypothetical protein
VDDVEEPATRQARLKAQRRSRRYSPRPMKVSGRSVFVLKRLVEEKAAAARSAKSGRR